jgi:hypothetical protein
MTPTSGIHLQQAYMMKGPAYGMPMHPAHYYGMPPPNMRMNDGYGNGRYHGNNRYAGRGGRRSDDRDDQQPRGRGRPGRKDQKNMQDEYQVCTRSLVYKGYCVWSWGVGGGG